MDRKRIIIIKLFLILQLLVPSTRRSEWEQVQLVDQTKATIAAALAASGKAYPAYDGHDKVTIESIIVCNTDSIVLMVRRSI